MKPYFASLHSSCHKMKLCSASLLHRVALCRLRRRVISGALRPLHPRVTFVLAKVTKTVLPRKARRQTPPVPRVSGRPQEVRIRRIPAPDAHVCDPSHTPLGSTSAFPRRSLATGLNSHSAKPRWLHQAPHDTFERRKPLLAPSLLRRPGAAVLLCRRNGWARPNGCKRAFFGSLDPRRPGRGSCGRTGVHPILLPAELSLHEQRQIRRDRIWTAAGRPGRATSRDGRCKRNPPCGHGSPLLYAPEGRTKP